jgi:hypothetical protein
MSEQTENKSVYMQSSGVMNYFNQHVAAMAPYADCPEQYSFAIQAQDLSLQILQHLAECYSVGNKCYVVFQHEGVFEVYRAADGTPRNLLLLYSNKTPAKKRTGEKEVESALTMAKTLLGKYVNLANKDVVKYDNDLTPELQQQGIVSQTYLQRRLLPTAAFRRHQGGANEAFRQVIDSLVDLNLLQVKQGQNKTFFEINLAAFN